MKGTTGVRQLWGAVVGLAVVATAAAAGLSLRGTPIVEAQEDAGTPAYYTQRVQPVLAASCYRCHGNGARRGGFNMDTRQGMLAGGHDGSGVVPGHPEQSWVVRLIRHEGPADDPMPMPPPPRPKLSEADIAAVTAWVRAGAAMPDGGAPAPHGR